MFETDRHGNLRWLNYNEEMGVLRRLVPALHEKIAEQRRVIEQYEEREQERRWPRER